MSELTLLNFYVPAFNFVLFIGLFGWGFRSLFVGMARQQKDEFLRAKSEAEREIKAAEAELRELLYQEQELAKKNRSILEQAEQDSQQRARQIIEDAKFKAAQIQEETQRLIRADYLAARKQLHDELQHKIESIVTNKVEKMSLKAKTKYLNHELEDLNGLMVSSSLDR